MGPALGMGAYLGGVVVRMDTLDPGVKPSLATTSEAYMTIRREVGVAVQ